MERTYEPNAGFKRLEEIIIDNIGRQRPPLLIVIAGGSCSGKTWLADLLKEYLDSINASGAVVPLDRFFLDRDDPDLPRDRAGRKFWDVPEAFYRGEFQDAVLSLAKRRDAYLPCYDEVLNRRDRKKIYRLRPRPVIIAEGLFAITFLRCLDHKQMLKVFMAADERTRLNRRIGRDLFKYSLPEEKIREIFNYKVAPCHERYVEPQRFQSDMIINTSEMTE